jgi:hypothetical protein
MIVCMEPEERLERIRKARGEYDRARSRLFREISDGITEGEALPEGEQRRLGPSAIGRAAGFTREYIAKIRAGRADSSLTIPP